MQETVIAVLGSVLSNVITFFGMPYNWSFYHPGPIDGDDGGGILLFRYSMVNVYGLTFYI